MNNIITKIVSFILSSLIYEKYERYTGLIKEVRMAIKVLERKTIGKVVMKSCSGDVVNLGLECDKILSPNKLSVSRDMLPEDFDIEAQEVTGTLQIVLKVTNK